jgi:CDP-glycerol glycerophosphotransferase (TagB/SpsB family)
MLKIAFLILDNIHHIPHLAPIAFEMSKSYEYQCTIYIQPHGRQLLNKIAVCYPSHRCEIKLLAPSYWDRLKGAPKKYIYYSGYIIEKHANNFLGYDALVSADIDLQSLIQKTQTKDKRPLFCLCHHGAGDRSHYFNALIINYDFVLLPNEKYRARFAESDYWQKDKFAVIGYPKFDVFPEKKHHFFQNSNPTIIYNPHFNSDFSSWEKWGIDILEFFYHNQNYNFIFAPHCILFRRKLNSRKFPQKFRYARHMHIDLGSELSADMTYINSADIYLGDVSSQIYEFIRKPRPCIFLNAHGINWKKDKNYQFWHFGTVINELSEVKDVFSKTSVANPRAEIQEKVFMDNFPKFSESAASRACLAIHNKLCKHFS